MSAKPQEDLQKAHKRRRNRESFLETIESIVVAFVLAFIFRAFIVEAFVIPTGSMGPTLYGAHAEFTCSDCGYEFAIGADGTAIPEPLCPNCFLTQNTSRSVPVFHGDRLLVLKFLYDFEEPERWDVIVFRNPTDPSQNYIKRLIALPGETVELVRGDLTINGRVVTKTDKAQQSLWMPVHDTRARPMRRGWTPRWEAEEPWLPDDHGFSIEAPPKGRTPSLVYRHRDAAGRLINITDFYAYNGQAGKPGTRASTLTDLCMRTLATAGSADSRMVVEMRAYKDRFRFELTAAGGQAPTRILVNGREVARADAGALPVGKAVEVLAANIDHKLMLRVDGRNVPLVMTVPASPEGDPTYEPTAVTTEEREKFSNPSGGDPPPSAMAYELRLGAAGGPLTLGYLRLDRDVYYINETITTLETGQRPGHGTEGNPFTLREDEFFVCGDNSPKSFDARLWVLPNAEFPNARPAVPRSNLVGKAFFVYWPAAGRRLHLPLMPDPSGWRMVH